MTDETPGWPPEIRFFDDVAPFLVVWDQYAAMSPERIAAAWKSHYHDLLPTDVQRSLGRHRFAGDLPLEIPRLATAHRDFVGHAAAVRCTAMADGGAFPGKHEAAGIGPKADYSAGLRLIRRLLEHHSLPGVV